MTKARGGGKSHKRDFKFKVSISEIEENHAHEHVKSMQGLM